MSLIVLDASVAVKWYLPRDNEPLVEEAFEILTRCSNQELAFIAPDLFWAEFGNVMWKAVRQGRISEEGAGLALSEIRDVDIDIVSSADLTLAALGIAVSDRQTFYDSLYVALADRMEAPLVTADERLVNALGSRYPVRWLGSFSIT